ncbi:hypothetical protein CALCODRAFT_520644, partial [Calocera cornea HHB12733]
MEDRLLTTTGGPETSTPERTIDVPPGAPSNELSIDDIQERIGAALAILLAGLEKRTDVADVSSTVAKTPSGRDKEREEKSDLNMYIQINNLVAVTGAFLAGTSVAYLSAFNELLDTAIASEEVNEAMGDPVCSNSPSAMDTIFVALLLGIAVVVLSSVFAMVGLALPWVLSKPDWDVVY